MSTSATTSAKRRRAGPLTVQPAPPGPSLSRATGRAAPTSGPVSGPVPVPVPTRVPVPQPSSPPSAGPSIRALTVQQAISVIDGRLLTLEKIALDQQSGRNTTDNAASSVSTDTIQTLLHEHLSEFNHRYELLATELMELKETVLKLQSYTMDINKSLINERIQILSDIPSHSTIGTLREDAEDDGDEDDGSVKCETVENESVELNDATTESNTTVDLTGPVTQDMMDAEVLLRGLRLST